MNLESELRGECRKIITRFELYARELRDDDARRTRRTGKRHSGDVLRPQYWDIDTLFNPYHVRASASAISRAVKLGLRNRNYKPYSPVSYEVPKPDGSNRVVCVFNIPDSIVSKRVYRSLLFKNKSRLSAYSYAYRDDLTAHDAIQHISSELSGNRRMFLAEYDFSKYFDSISHAYLWRIIEEKKFLVTSLERTVLTDFLQLTPVVPGATYQRSLVGAPRSCGVPQGTSISLFLANVAAWELDRRLERLGVGFARYADDTLIWSHDYARICEAVEALTALSSEIGPKLNFRKSSGISIFTPEGTPAEFKPKSIVEFVGYRFGEHGAGMRENAVRRVKRRLAYLIWSNLLEPLLKGRRVASRWRGTVDRDYQVMIMQIRRYLYGNLTEAKIRKLRDGKARRLHYPGVMSYFPLVDDMQQLKELDGWLSHTIHTSLVKRTRILRSFGTRRLPIPHGLSKAATLQARTPQVDLRIPSFVRVSTLIRRAAAAHGANAVGRRSGALQYWYS